MLNKKEVQKYSEANETNEARSEEENKIWSILKNYFETKNNITDI